MNSKKGNLNNLEGSNKNQIILALIWILIQIGLFITLHVIGAVDTKNQIFVTMIFGFSILILWILIRWTMFEKMQLKFKTFSDKKMSEKSDMKATTMDLDEYRKFRHSKSKYGFYIMAIVNIVLIITWTII